MAKDILIVKCERDVPFVEWDNITNYIKSEVRGEYHVIGLFNGFEIECITEDDKVFSIDGEKYSYKSIKEAIESTNKNKEITKEEKQEQDKKEETEEPNNDNVQNNEKEEETNDNV